jgi:DNA sulfur modification protein DndB
MAESKKKRAIQFEETIKSFMEKLEFADVEGAKDTFLINGIQVDVCGGHENTLLVVECTMRQELGRKSIREKIKELRGVAPSLEKGFKRHPTYKKYKFIRYILATRNIDIRREDIEFANAEIPRIYIWDDNFIAYYDDLYNKIKSYAKFNLLGEIGVRPSQQNIISVPAFLSAFGKIKMYTFMIDPRDLLEVSYVARRETKNERFYQRIVRKERLVKIAKYINEGNILPNNLIISFGEYVSKFIKFHILQKDYVGKCTSGLGISYGILEFPRDYRSCWIIDGQHRLYAFVNSEKSFYMPVTAFENLGIEKQCKIFLDINKNQKPVPPDLVWDLNGDMIPSEEDGMISNVVKLLNNSGPLYHKIYIPSKGIKMKGNLLRMAGICLSIKRTKLAKENTQSKTANPFYSSEPEKTVKNLHNALSNYFTCVQKLMPEDWRLENKGFVLDDGGNSVMIRLFEKIINRCVMKGTIPNEEEYIKYLKPLANLFFQQYKTAEDLKKLKLRITSEGGKDELLKEFIVYIKQETGDNLFGGEIESITTTKLKELERKFKELIRVVLSKDEGDNWFKKKIPQDIYNRALRNMKKHGEKDTQKLYLQIILGECFTIMRKYKSQFYPLFKKGEYGFGSDAEIEGAFDLISRVRGTQLVHDVGVKKKTHDDQLFEIYIDKFNRLIEPIIS